MACHDGTVSLRPRTALQLIDGSCGLLRRQARAIVPIVLGSALPVLVLMTWARHAVGLHGGGDFGSSLADLGDSVDGGQVAVSWAAIIVQSLLLTLVGGAIAVVASADAVGDAVTAGGAVRQMARRLPALVVGWLIAKVLLVVSGCLVIGAIALIVWTLVLAPAIVLESLGPYQGLQRSIQLTSRRFFPCAGIVLLTGLVSSVVSLAMAALPLLVGLASPLESFDWVLVAVGELASTVIVVPIVCGTAALAYLDLRVRTEGLDLQLELASA
jgi:hypothetical protein